jgi:predicted amidohydrolase YtcJ
VTADLVIQNGRVVTPGGVIAGGVAIAGETIVAVGADRELPAARRRVDARDQYVLPGLIDAHVHPHASRWRSSSRRPPARRCTSPTCRRRRALSSSPPPGGTAVRSGRR